MAAIVSRSPPQTNGFMPSMSTIVDYNAFIRAGTKLHGMWSRKAAGRPSTSKIFVSDPSSPAYHVAYLMNIYLNQAHATNKNLVQNFKNLWDAYGKTQIIQVMFPYEERGKMWVYETRKSDFQPRTQRDMEKLLTFVDFLLSYDKYFQGDLAFQRDYLRKHISIAASFMIFFLTTPDYFYLIQRTTYTTKHGKQKEWFPILLNKFPKPQEKKQRLAHNMYKSESSDLTNTLPKLLESQARLGDKMYELIESHHGTAHHVNVDFQKDSMDTILRNLSPYFQSLDDKCLPSGKAKKLQKYLQDMEKNHRKIIPLKKKAQITDEQHDSAFGANVKKVRPTSSSPSSLPVVIPPPNQQIQEADADVPDDWEDASW